VVEIVTVSETLLHKPGFSYRMVHVIFNGECNNLGAGFLKCFDFLPPVLKVFVVFK
jgi:hypothetical protein